MHVHALRHNVYVHYGGNNVPVGLKGSLVLQQKEKKAHFLYSSLPKYLCNYGVQIYYICTVVLD